MKNPEWYEEIKEEMLNDLLDIADYIAYNNKDFICTACITTLDKLKDYVHKHFNFEQYMCFTEVIDSRMEDSENE